jgi:S1-C subfamily serine protease
MMRAPTILRTILLLGGPVLLCVPPAPAGETHAETDSFEESLARVAERWKNRVFVVVADAGPARVPVDRVMEDPKVLFRKRRVGCAIYMGEQRFLLTTASVVGESREVEIFDQAGRHVLARIVGKDRYLDLAVLETFRALPETEGLPAPELVESPPRGTTCLLLGNAYGGSLSASLGTFEGMLVIDPEGMPVQVRRVAAPIYPGDSGGPVVDTEGRFLGIVTAACQSGPAIREGSIGEIDLEGRPTEPAAAEGLAIPAGTARRAWHDLVRHGHVRRGFLGVEMSGAPEGDIGARILSVLPDSPAQGAGIRPGDVITVYREQVVANARQLCALVAGTWPRAHVDIEYRREGVDVLATVEIGEAVAPPGPRRLRRVPPIGANPLPPIPVVQDTRR